mgnify:CR=1 FL=1
MNFAELVAASNYSFLRGASHPADMVWRAALLGMSGIGIADRNSVAGVVRAHVAWREVRAQMPADHPRIDEATRRQQLSARRAFFARRFQA